MIYQFTIGSTIHAVRALSSNEARETIKRAFGIRPEIHAAPDYAAPSIGSPSLYDDLTARIDYASNAQQLRAAQTPQPKVSWLKPREMNKARLENRLLKKAHKLLMQQQHAAT